MKVRHRYYSYAMKAVRLSLRIALGTGLAVFIYAGPGYQQVTGVHSQWVPRWEMFSGIALGMTRVHIEVRDDISGLPRTVHWEDYLPEPKPHQVRRAVVVRNESEIRTHGRRICRKEGGKAAVFISADVATREGWKALNSGEKNLCENARWTPISERHKR